jgi:serine protein kinase
MKPSDFLKQAEEQRALDEKLSWEGSFADYLEIVSENPNVADLAHARMYDMITTAGVEDPGDGRPREYKFFGQEIFGLDRTLQQLVEEYLSPASRRLDSGPSLRRTSASTSRATSVRSADGG